MNRLNHFKTVIAAWILVSPVSNAQVVISEIHYHPVEEAAFDSTSTYNPVLDLSEDVHEFVEIQNTGASAVDLSGWKLSGSVDFTIPSGTSIPAGSFKVIAKNPTRIQTVYSISSVLGSFSGNLPNSGGSITLKDASNATMDSVSYSSSFPWAQSANALGAQDRFTGLTSSSFQYKGRSLQRVSTTASPGDPANWLASPATGPTPGAAQAVVRSVPKPVVIAKSHAQTSDGSTLIQPSAGVTVNCTFSSTASLTNVQLEWFVDLVDSSTETHTTTTMTSLGNGEYSATIAGQSARAIVRYRILADRGDGSEVVSPRADDPAISAVGASNAVQPWHGYFVNPTGRSTNYPNYDLFISTTNLAQIKTNAQQSPARVTALSATGVPRSVPWVASTAPLWDGTVPAVFACNGVLHDVQIRFHGSRYHRSSNATNLTSFKLHFPENQPFQNRSSWFITGHGNEFAEATKLNRLLGLPASKTRSVTWYLNSNSAVTKLEQGEYDGDMLDTYHELQAQLNPGSTKEETGELYKCVGNRDASQSNAEGPYTCGDEAPMLANSGWTQLQRYDWNFSLQNHGWKGPLPVKTLFEGMWTVRGDSSTRSGTSLTSNSTNLANTKAWLAANFDIDTTLTSVALLQWMGIWDDVAHNQFFWKRANGKWVRLGWDYDQVMQNSSGGMGGGYNTSIYNGEFGNVSFGTVNWWKDTFFKCYRTEFNQRLWELNNSFLESANLTANGLTTAATFAANRKTVVNSALSSLGTYTKPARPTNSSPATGSTVIAGASLTTSTYSHPASKTHLSTKWEIRSAAGDYETPVYIGTSTTSKASLAIPFDSLTYGQTYYWRATHIDSDSHPSIVSAETSFTWGTASTTAGTLAINEILANNRSAIANGVSYPDYIELRNNGTSAYNLTGLTLTDDVNVPAKYTFPSGNTLAAGEHLIVWCDSDTTSPGIHTGFSLSSGGQTILLMNGTTILDSVVFGPQAPDLSIGRVTNGTGSWTANNPSPGAANNAATLGSTTTLTINEWMANPAYGDDWFELHNSGTSPVAIGGLYLSDSSASPATTRIPALSYIGAGGFAKFLADGSTAGGNHCDFSLKATGESLVLTASNGSTNLDVVNFGTQSLDVSQGRFPDGGTTVSTFATTASPEKPNWLPNSVVISEIMSNPDSGDDWIELSNTGPSTAAIGAWWLSDDTAVPKKFQIPSGTTIPAGGTVVFTSTQFTAGTIPFAFSSGGDEACLSAVDGAGTLTGYRSQASFGAAAGGVSFGRVAATGLPNGSDGVDFWPQVTATSGAANGPPLTTPVILNEIMYHPVDNGSTDVFGTEFIELHNPTNAAVDLSGWRLKGDVAFTFASGTTIPAFGYLTVVNFDPATDAASLATFRSTYGLSSSVTPVGPFSPKLANNTARIELAKPDTSSGGTVYVNVDTSEYRDMAPWPVAADGTGVSLQRFSRSLIGNTAANWGSATPTPAALNSGLYTTLAIWSQSPLPAGTTGSAYSFTLVGVGGTPAYAWSITAGSLPPGLALTNGVISGIPETAGNFTFTLRLADSTAAAATGAFTLSIPSADSDNDGMPDDWEIANGLTVGVNDTALDADGDGQNNLAEYLAGTHPQSASSVFAVTSMTPPSGGQLSITWSAVAGKTYQIWSSTDLSNWSPLDSTITTANTGPQSASVNASGNSTFYRISVVP